MKIISWNVNGLRAATRKGFGDWLNSSDADIIGLQEVRALESQLDKDIAKPKGFRSHFSPAKKLGYSGVGLYHKLPIERMDTNLDIEEFDIEGRLQMAFIGKLILANVYFPNGGGKNRDNSRIPFKLDFYDKLFSYLDKVAGTKYRVLVMGDFNTAHEEIDLARPKENRNTSGFCQIERDSFSKILAKGYIDTFRVFNSEAGNYTWWSQRQNSRARNVGWRIDYVLASKNAMPFVKDAFILPNTLGSDHCPIGVVIDDKIIV